MNPVPERWQVGDWNPGLKSQRVCFRFILVTIVRSLLCQRTLGEIVLHYKQSVTSLTLVSLSTQMYRRLSSID